MCTGKEYVVVSLGIRRAWNEKDGTTMLEMEEDEREKERIREKSSARKGDQVDEESRVLLFLRDGWRRSERE